MLPASRKRDGSIPLTPPPRMGSAEKRSWPGDGRDCFPCLESTSKGRRCFRRQVKMPLERMLTNSPKQIHANHAEGVQYAINSFVCGLYGLQTRGATPMEAMKSAKRAFQRGVLSSISSNTLFMRSVSAALGKPPKYSNASIKHRIIVGQSQRLAKVTKRMRE